MNKLTRLSWIVFMTLTISNAQTNNDTYASQGTNSGTCQDQYQAKLRQVNAQYIQQSQACRGNQGCLEQARRQKAGAVEIANREQFLCQKQPQRDLPQRTRWEPSPPAPKPPLEGRAKENRARGGAEGGGIRKSARFEIPILVNGHFDHWGFLEVHETFEAKGQEYSWYIKRHVTRGVSNDVAYYEALVTRNGCGPGCATIEISVLKDRHGNTMDASLMSRYGANTRLRLE